MIDTTKDRNVQPERSLHENLKSLRATVNDCVKVFFPFLLLIIYVFSIAFSANDKLLFKDDNLSVPFLGMGFPASMCFTVMPWVLLVGHFVFLFIFTLMAQISGRDSDSQALLLFLKFIAFNILVVLPIATLGFIQIQFLGFQHDGITGMHTVVLLLDFLLILYLWPKIRTLYSWKEKSKSERIWRQIVRNWWWVSIPALMLSGFFFIAHMIGPHILDVRNKRLYLGSEKISPEQACKDKTLALNLTGRSYKRAGLSGSILCNAILSGAELQGADLSGAELQGVDLSGAELQGADLSGAKLHVADLSRAELHEANLSGAKLYVADLSRAELHEANLSGAKLHEANLSGAKLHEANLSGAKLYVADLSRAELHEADLREAELHGADLREAELHGADLREAELHGADLWGAELHGAGLSLAELHGAGLSGAELHGADLSGAELQGVDLSGAELQGADLSGAELQGADLRRADLRGVVSREPQFSTKLFKERIEERATKDSDLTGVILSGGLSKDDVDSVIKKMREAGVSADRISRFEMKIQPHIGTEKIFATKKTIEDHAAIVGAYTQEEAQQWIGEYMQSMCEALRGLDREHVLRLSSRIGISEDTIQGWYRDGHCPQADQAATETQ